MGKFLCWRPLLFLSLLGLTANEARAATPPLELDVELTPPPLLNVKAKDPFAKPTVIRDQAHKLPSTFQFKSSLKKDLRASNANDNTYTPVDAEPYFDLPVTYNARVRQWINVYQGQNRNWFRKWLERSSRYLPTMQQTLTEKGLPKDLAFIAMIESGFSAKATSEANAVGYWQFIKPTADRYGLKVNWWLDERRDFTKSTKAAARYISDLFREFGSWHLTAAAYNMGEGRTRQLIRRYQTKNYWVLSEQKGFPQETRDYIPKLIASILIAKAPKLYGFYDVTAERPYSYEYFHVPGGTDLNNLASFLSLDSSALLKLNPELLQGFVPKDVFNHQIRIPKGFTRLVSQYVRDRL